MKTTLPLGPFRPDIATIDNEAISEATNVYPGPNAYLPIPSLSSVSSNSLGTGNDTLTKVMLYFDGADASTTITDNNVGGSAHTWTAAGNAQIDTAQSKFGGSSLLCDGTGDWVSTPEHTDFAVVTNDWTVECFARPATDGALLYICGCADSGLSAATSLFVISRTAANKVEAKVSNGSAFTTLTGTSTNFTTGSFKHVRLVKSGTSLILYLDGTQEATGTITSTNTTGGNPLVVGAGGSITTTPWNGWIDGFRYDTSVAGLGGARSTGSSFTVPTADYDLCRGLFQAKMTTGLDAFFAGTVRKIWKFTYSSGVWTDVTRASGPYSLAPGDLWSGAQFGANFYMTQVSDVLQSIDATSGGNFAATAGSPPQAGHVATIGDFLVLSGLSSNKKTIQWSAINDPTGWTVGTNLSDQQTMPDGGDVVGVAGDTVGIVVQERALRTMQFLPGDTDRIFAFSKVESEKGCVGKAAFVYTNNTLFFRSSDGFYAWDGALRPIGHDAINRYFATNFVNPTQKLISAFAATDAPRALFATSGPNPSGNYGRLFIFDWDENRWSECSQGAQAWAAAADSSRIRTIGAVDGQGQFSLLNGTNNLEANITTAKVHLDPGMRSFVSNVYPIILGSATITITPKTYEDLNDSVVTGTASSLEAGTGWASILSSARIHSFRIGIAAGTWSHAMGLIVDHTPDGEA